MPPPAPAGAAFVALRLFLPFALGNLLASLYRNVNKVLAPAMEQELAIGDAAVGAFTSAYFLAFALVQLPLGLALDRFGPRRTQAVLLAVAATGAMLFALADDGLTLALAEGLIGIGVAGAMMAAFKLFALWLPKPKLALANGLLLACGGLGGMIASAPAAAAAEVLGWHGLYHLLAAATAGVAVLICLAVPERRGADEGGGRQLRGLVFVLRSRLFWQVAPLAMTAQAVWLSMQMLWFAPWLRDVAGLAGSAAADTLFAGGAGVVAGYVGLGWLASRLERNGISAGHTAAAGTALFIAVQLPIALGWPLPAWMPVVAFLFSGTAPLIFHAWLSQGFGPALAGRANTSLTLLAFALTSLFHVSAGWVLERFPAADGGHTGLGYLVVFGAWIAGQAAAFAWFLAAGRGADGQRSRRRPAPLARARR